MTKQINKYLNTLPFYKKKFLCKAPFTSIRLCLNGNIQVCCVNSNFIIGKYPETNIRNAWFSDKINELRNRINDKDLSLGCNVCKTQIENLEFTSVKSRFYNHLNINKTNYPSLIEFELDNTCNLECIMCNPHTSSAILNKCNFNFEKSPYNDSILNEIEEFIPHLTHANFIGGEPFLIPLYFSIINKMLDSNPKIRFNISTNGTILNEKIKSLLSRGKFDISISIDSLNKETFETIRVNARLDNVLENLSYFHNYCKTSKTYLSVWLCPIKLNAFEIPDFIRYFEERDIPVFFNTVMMPHNLSLWYLNSKELGSIKDFYRKSHLKGRSNNIIRFNDLIKQIESWENAAKSREINTKQLIHLNGKELIDVYNNNIMHFVNATSNFKIEEINFILHELIKNKNEKQIVKILLFLISIPVSDSLDLLLSNKLDYMNYYVEKSFNTEIE